MVMVKEMTRKLFKRLWIKQNKYRGGGCLFSPWNLSYFTKHIRIPQILKVSGKEATVLKVDSKKDYSVFVISSNEHDVVIEGMNIVNNKQTELYWN